MGKAERIGLWVLVGLLAVWLLVLTVMVAGELAAINRLLGRGAGGEPVAAGRPTPWWGGSETEPEPTPASSWSNPPAGGGTGPQVGIAGVRVLSDTLAMTVTVRSSGAGDLLYEPPVVVDDGERVYPVTPDSLEAARLAFLDLVTRGQAMATLEFAGAPAAGARLVLVFNPGQQPGDILAPYLEVPVPVLSGGKE